MKKYLLSFVLSFMAVVAFADNEVTLKAGTVIPLQVLNPTRAAHVKVGQKVGFQVSRRVDIDGMTAIPYGTIVNGIVYEAKKSSWWGTKGRLGIRINEIVMPNGTVIPLTNSDVYVTGENRTALSVVLFCFIWPACFICGSKAELPNGYTTQAYVATDTRLVAE